MEFTNPETRFLATRLYAHELVLRAVFDTSPNALVAAWTYVKEFEEKMLFADVPDSVRDEKCEYARRIIYAGQAPGAKP